MPSAGKIPPTGLRLSLIHILVDLGAYPGIVQKKNEAVLGDVYFVSPEMMAEMDRYEDEGNLYPVSYTHLCTERVSGTSRILSDSEPQK